MKIGDRVFIIPAHSLRFGARWGKIVGIDNEGLMPYIISFDESSRTYRFSRNEFMDEETFLNYLSKHQWCYTRDYRRVRLLECCSFDDIKVQHGKVHFHLPASFLLPVKQCKGCGREAVAVVGDFCEDCEYPLPSAT